MICDTTCPYFPVFPNEIAWEADDFGVKHRAVPITYICSYDNHRIISWDKNICPRENKDILFNEENEEES